MSINDQNTSYRRGVILGLTLAEIMLLILFLLLLLFMTVIKKERAKNADKPALVAKNRSIEKIVHTLEKQDPSIMEDLVLANEKLPEIIRMIKKEDVKVDNSESIPETITRAIEKLKVEKQIKNNTGAKPVEQQLQEAISIQENLKSEISNLRGQNKSLMKQGKGLTYPPCWALPNGQPEYIYDISLTNTGIIIHDNKIPSKSTEQSKLPISMIEYETVLSNSSFYNQTSALLQFSKRKENDCRFYVRIFDETGNDKKLYISLSKAVEGSFYPLLMRGHYAQRP